MAIVLGENRYGKAENRVFRVTRNGETHDILDLNVSVQLSGDFTEAHLAGDNAKVLPTDTQKNTVFAMSQKHGAMEPEAFGLLLARHFVSTQPHVARAEVRLQKFAWERIASKGAPHPRAFRRDGSATRVARVLVQRGAAGDGAFVVSGVEDLVILKTGDSEFKGYLRDPFTTLAETSDRIMATQVTAQWRHAAGDAASLDRVDWAASHRDALNDLLSTFAEHHSLSLQHTMYAMGERVLARQPGIAAIRMSLPNKHHFAVDLTAFGQANHGEVFIAADRPYGLIEAEVTRDDAPPAPAPWPSW